MLLQPSEPAGPEQATASTAAVSSDSNKKTSRVTGQLRGSAGTPDRSPGRRPG